MRVFLRRKSIPMNKSFIVFIVSLILLISTFGGSTYATEDRLINGGFESVEGELPQGWYTDVWNKNGTTSFYVEQLETHSGKSYITIQSSEADDGKVIQRIKVKPDTTYLLSCWVKTYEVGSSAKGANISVIGVVDTSEDITGTSEQWQRIELYGKTGKEQKEMQVAVRIGGYGSVNTGRASFDDFAVQEVTEVPQGARVISFLPEALNDENASKKTVEASGLNSVMTMGLFILVIISVIYFGFNNQKDKLKVKLKSKKEKHVLISLLFLAFVIRIVIAITNEGYTGDIYCFKSWADLAASKGLSNFYVSKVFVDYPPGYIYVLYLLGKFQALFSLDWSSSAALLLIKFPAILADIAGSYVIYRISREKTGSMIALVLCTIYAFNPAILINSAAWGQVDAFYTLFLVIMLYLVLKDRLLEASLIFTLSALIKPQTFIFTPILIFAFIKRKNIKVLAGSAISSLLMFILLILPFSMKQNPLWIIDKYKATLASYPYGTLNAFNVFAFIGGNWAPNTTKLFFLTYSTWGLIFTVLIVIFGGYVFFKSKHNWILAYVSFFTITAVFMLSTKMHERYMFPALILSLIWYVFSKDKRALHLFLGLSFTNFVNVAYVLQWAQQGVVQIPKSNSILMLTSLANICLFIWVIKIGLEYSSNTVSETYQVMENETDEVKQITETTAIGTAKIVKKDFIIMAALTLIYSLVAFVNLGSTKVPESFWKPSAAGESFYVDLGANKTLDKISYYAGLGEGSYNVSFSTDNIDWYGHVLLNENNIYNWNIADIEATARYVKFTVEKPGGMLNEIGIFERGGQKPLEIKNIHELQASTQGQGDIHKAFDEQRYARSSPSYLTGMIFDEIYHGRTAYEMLNRLEPFEWTHPPLGKILISLGVMLFGMNPFGWRIIGTLFGIAMIPCIYILAKKLFKKTGYAFLAAFLMTFDFMHFTQTRIATVDVYGVFFIILMYYFMYRFTEAKPMEEGFKKSIILLALSGISFALGAASKWISFYAAVGLAIIFFKEIYDRYNQYKYALKYINSETTEKDTKEYELCIGIKNNFKKQTYKTIGWASIFFIIVPIIVYIMSYIPFMLVPGPGHELVDVFKYQKYMYEYHSKLVATHPFESTWLQWPSIERPIWYYSGQSYLPEGKISSIVAMGNPAVWWIGAISFLTVIAIGIKKKDKTAFFIVIGGLSQYLPWMLVHRLVFIYHFFASVPFIILSIVYVAAYFYEKKKSSRYFIYGYMVVVIVLFIMFYPVISGMVVDKSYAESFLKWFETWYFFH